MSRRAAALALALGLGACVIPGPPGAFHPVDGERESIAWRLSELRAQGDARHSLRLLGKLLIESPSGSGNLTEVILAARPGRLRLETLDPLGQTRALLVTDGETYAYYDGERLDRGPATAALLVDRLGVDLAPTQAVEALLAAPLRATTELVWVRGRGAEREVRLDGERLRLGPEGELRFYEALGPDGEVLWFARYDDWRDVPGGRYPSRLELFFPRTGVRAELRVRRAKLNEEIDQELFRIPQQASR